MVRKLLSLFVLVFLVSITVFPQKVEKTGGYARLLGMGNNTYITDPYFITFNPAWGNSYDNFLFGDLGAGNGNNFGPGGTGQFAAANFRLDNSLTLGGILSRSDFNGFSIATLDPGGLVNRINNLIEGNGVVPLNNNIEIMGSYRFNSFTIGLGIAYASTTNEDNPPDGGSTTGSASQLGINAGILAKLTGNSLLDVGVSLLLPSASYEPPATPQTKLSQTWIGVNARFFYQYSQKLAFVPTAIFTSASGTIDDGGNSSDLPSNLLFGIGFGINYSVGDFLLAGGPAFTYSKVSLSGVEGQSPDISNSVLTFPIWNLGVEWNMLDWLVARLGYTATTSKVTTETPVSTTTVRENITTGFFGPNGATVGIGFRFGGFSLDATVNEDVLRQGLNNIGGGGPTFAYLSASYAMP